MQNDLFRTTFESALRHYEGVLAEKFGRAPALDQPFEPDTALTSLRARLITEEANEVAEALEDGTKAELAKELADLLFVTIGTFVAYDIPVLPAFLAVYEDNLKRITTGTINPETGKMMKAMGYPKLDLTSLVGA
jgi:NTP pyrophosphatase (non-canonical NTP hydrolase)